MENAHHGTRIERCYANRDYSEITKKATATRIAKGMFRHVKQYDTDMNLVAEYNSVAEASRCIGTAPSNIHHAIKTYKGKKPYLGYIWV